MSTLYVMVGLPGSGKSTIAEGYLKRHYSRYGTEEMSMKIFSSDEYRKNLLGDIEDQSQNQKVFDTLFKDLKMFLSCGDVTAIFDATNITVKSRRKIFESIRNLGCRVVAVVVPTTIEQCIRNNEQRERVVPIPVLFKMMKQFEMPQKFEGFTDILIGYDFYCNRITTGYVDDAAETIVKMFEFDQHNKHHKYTLGEHSYNLAKNYPMQSVLYYAGLWHDIGKMHTQSFTEDGQAHYYSHENVSAYYLLSHKYLTKLSMDDLCECLFYINNHMHIRDIIKSEKAINKYKQFWGEERFRNLIDFMNNDNGASGRVMNEGCEK